jgi:hypothetical protein
MRVFLLLALLCAAAITATPASAADFSTVLTADAPAYGWDGGPGNGAGVGTVPCDTSPVYDCEDVLFRVAEGGRVVVDIAAGAGSEDLDLYLYESDADGKAGAEIGSAATAGAGERYDAAYLSPGFYIARVGFFSATNGVYRGTLTYTPGDAPPPPSPPAPACAGRQAPPAATGSANFGAPTRPDPDIAPETAADEIVTAFADETFTFTEAFRHQEIDVPELPDGATGSWDRVILVFENRQPGDPFDRVFGITAGGVELLRGTTPRVDFTMFKDVTELTSLFVPGEPLDVGLLQGTYLGSQISTVRFEFYDDEPTAQYFAPAGTVRPVVTYGSLNGDGCSVAGEVDFGEAAPGSAVLDLTISGHSSEEFWWCAACNANNEIDPRQFHVLVDGVELGKVVSLPYVYALAGFETDAEGNQDPAHGPVWWTAQQALDRAGIHTGVGEIPPFRVEVPAENLELLQGDRTIEVIQENGPENAGVGRWITSLRVLTGLEKPARRSSVPRRNRRAAARRRAARLSARAARRPLHRFSER